MGPGNAGINGTEVESIVDSATESLQQFLIDFNLKCGLGLASANTATIGSESSLAQKTKAAQIDVRINGEKVEDSAKKIRFEDKERALYSLNQAATIETAY